MSAAEHYLAALDAMRRARYVDDGSPKQVSLMANAQARAALATAGAALLSAGVKKLPELPTETDGITTWSRAVRTA